MPQETAASDAAALVVFEEPAPTVTLQKAGESNLEDLSMLQDIRPVGDTTKSAAGHLTRPE